MSLQSQSGRCRTLTESEIFTWSFDRYDSRTLMSLPTVSIDNLSVLDLLRQRSLAAILTARRAFLKPSASIPGFIALLDQGTVSITNFATAVMIGRVCGKAELGIYSLAFTLITIATGIISTLMSTPTPSSDPSYQSLEGACTLEASCAPAVAFNSICSCHCFVSVEVGGKVGSRGSVSNVGAITAAVIVFISFREFVRSVSFAELR